MRTPDTTSSPWALGRKSPDGVGSPVISSREKATPEHESSPLLPNTICWTLTAVPQSSGMRLDAPVVPRAVAHPGVEDRPDRLRQLPLGLLGEVLARLVLVDAPELLRERPEVVDVELEVELDAGLLLPLLDRVLVALAGDALADVAEHLGETAVESQPKRSLLVERTRPFTDSSVSPRLRIVSSIPGIDSRPPERTETSSGSAGSSSRFPACLRRARPYRPPGRRGPAGRPACAPCRRRRPRW